MKTKTFVVQILVSGLLFGLGIHTIEYGQASKVIDVILDVIGCVFILTATFLLSHDLHNETKNE